MRPAPFGSSLTISIKSTHFGRQFLFQQLLFRLGLGMSISSQEAEMVCYRTWPVFQSCSSSSRWAQEVELKCLSDRYPVIYKTLITQQGLVVGIGICTRPLLHHCSLYIIQTSHHWQKQALKCQIKIAYTNCVIKRTNIGLNAMLFSSKTTQLICKTS